MIRTGALTLLFVTLLIVALCGCEKYPTAEQGLSTITAITVSPADAVVEVSPDEPTSIQYTATITRLDGSVEQTTVVEWDSSNLTLGEIGNDGVFSTTDSTGGRTNVSAAYMGARGQATLTIVYVQEVITEDTPENAPELFDAATVTGSADAPSLLYPLDQVKLPRNTPQIEFQWDTGAACNLFHLQFTSEVTQVDVYTTGLIWIPDEQLWHTIAAANAGGITTLELTGVEMHVDHGVGVADGEPLTAAEPSTLHISRLDAQGSIYYWNALIGGVYRIPFGGAEAEPFYGQDNYGHCVSCHVLSPDGSKMAVTYDGDNGTMGLISMEEPLDDSAATIPYSAGEVGNFKTFSPDGLLLLSSHNGLLRVHDATSGEYWYTVELPFLATQPSWSPRGDRIAVVMPDEDSFDWDWSFNGGRIALLHVDDQGNIGTEPDVLVSSDDGSNNYYPAFSPDGDWIAFNRSWNTDGTTDSCDSYDDPSATLMAISSDGSVVLELTAANGVGELSNSWPGWAPLPDADVLWLTFSSRRPYGFLANQSGEKPQIWVTAFDLNIAAEGTADPSSPPFWLPFQDLGTNNHIPVWGPE